MGSHWTERAAVLRGTKIRVGQYLVILRPGYVGQVGVFRGTTADGRFVVNTTTGANFSLQLQCLSCEVQLPEEKKGSRKE